MPEFEELYKEYYFYAYKYVLSLCKNEQIAEEITQETFFKVLKNANKFHGQCKFSVWICQIAKNTYFSYYKKNKKLLSSQEEIILYEQTDNSANIDEYVIENNPENLFINKDLEMKIHKILHVMAEPYREVFWMRTFGELSFKEIAEIHDKSENWARVTYHRARLKIKEELK